MERFQETIHMGETYGFRERSAAPKKEHVSSKKGDPKAPKTYEVAPKTVKTRCEGCNNARNEFLLS